MIGSKKKKPFRSLRTKAQMFCLCVLGSAMSLGALGMLGSNIIGQTAERVSHAQVPQMQCIYLARQAVLEGHAVLVEGISEVNEPEHFDRVRVYEGRLRNSMIMFDMYIKALMWGSESVEFRRAAGGLVHAMWNRHGMAGRLVVDRATHHLLTRAQNADVHYVSFSSNARQALKSHRKSLRLALAHDVVGADATRQRTDQYLQKALSSAAISQNEMLVMSANIDEQMVHSKAEIVRIQQLILWMMSAGSLVLMCLILTACFIFVRKMLVDPLHRIIEGVQRIGSGNLGTRVRHITNDELGILGSAFNRMAAELDRTTVTKLYVQEILATMTEMVIVVTPQTTMLSVNEAACRVLKYREEELVGEPLLKVFWQQTTPFKDGWLRELSRSGAIRDLQTTCVTRDNEPLSVKFSAAPMLDNRGKTHSIVCVIQDITEQLEAETERERLASFPELNSDPVAEMHVDGEILYLNPAARRLFPTLESEGASHPYVKGWRRVLMIDNEQMRPTAMRMVQVKDMWLEQNVHWVADTNAVRFYARDVTERLRAETELTEANQELSKNERAIMNVLADLERSHRELETAQAQLVQREKLASLGQLAAGVAHEINNPMGFVLSNLQTMERYCANIHESIVRYRTFASSARDRLKGKPRTHLQDAESFAEQIDMDYLLEDLPSVIEETKEGALRVKRIVADLKTFSRPDEAELQLVDIHGGLDSTLNIVWNELKYTVTIEKEYGELPTIQGYPQQLNQVFLNLLINAAQAIEDQGTITISTFQQNGDVCVQIQDTGKGIPEEELPKIFDPFFTTKPVGEGTGLGLAIVHGIVEKHGGSIDVSSEQGEGTTFTVRLPCGRALHE